MRNTIINYTLSKLRTIQCNINLSMEYMTKNFLLPLLIHLQWLAYFSSPRYHNFLKQHAHTISLLPLAVFGSWTNILEICYISLVERWPALIIKQQFVAELDEDFVFVIWERFVTNTPRTLLCCYGPRTCVY